MEFSTNFERIDELILSFLRGKITFEEKQGLKDWLSEDNANKEYFREIYLLWKACSIADLNHQNEKVAESLKKVHYKIFEAEKETPFSYKRTAGYIAFSKLRLVAAILLILGLGAFFSYFLVKDENKNVLSSLNEIKVPLGSKSIVVLPDKTEVWLNAGTKLTYSRTYGEKSREVNLEGEGYFKVVKMQKKPFIVHTQRANIKALGTEFNVKAYPEENTIETILVKGSVVINKITGVENDQNSKSIVLKPGQKVLIFKDEKIENVIQDERLVATNNPTSVKVSALPARISRKEMVPEISNTNVETSWKDQSWVIQGEELKDLFVKIGRRYNVTIELKDKELERYKFSAIIENETLEQVFDVMALTIPLTYNIEKGFVVITLNQKLEKKYKRAYF
jgi:transmembrane sensor